MPELVLGWGSTIWAVGAAVCLIAGVVRGVVGFGYALIVIGGLNVVALPSEVVPLATLLDLVCGINMIPRVWRDVHWQGAHCLGVGALIGIPIGITLLVRLDVDVIRLGISFAILISVLLISRGFSFSKMPGSPLMLLTGGLAGFLSGSAGIPGPPLILVYLSSPLPIRMTRATTVAFLLLTDSVALVYMASQDLVTMETLARGAVLAPISFIGIAIGVRLFKVAQPDQVKSAALWLLAALAIVGIAKVLIS